MDESFEAHMETDVSSTTDDVPDTPDVTGSHGDVEMVVIVEEVKEEQDSSIDTQEAQSHNPKTSNASLSDEAFSQKEATPSNTVTNSPVKENHIAKALLLSPTINEPQKILNKSSPVSVNEKSSPVKKQEPVSSASSTKVHTSSSKPVQKPVDRSPVKISHVQNLQKSPFKGIKLVTKPPFKLKRLQVKPPNNEGNKHEKSLLKYVQQTANQEVNMQKISKKEVKLQQTSSDKAAKLQENINNQPVTQEKSSNKGVTLQENLSKETQPKLQEKSLTKEKLVEPTPATEVKLVENSNSELDLKDKPSTDDKLEDSTTLTILDASTSDSSKANTEVPSSDSVKTDNVTLQPENSETTDIVTLKTDNVTIQEVKNATTDTVTLKTDNVTIQPANSDAADIVTLPADTVPNNDTLNDTHNTPDVSEKEHNKSISRELKSLINSAKESKIISECTQLTSKTRKSRSQLDTSNISLNASLDPDKVERPRRGSTNSQVSSCSEMSDRSALKRSMRSQNPEFVNKCKQFIQSVTAKTMKDSDEAMSEDETNTDSSQSSLKKKIVSELPVLDGKPRSDAYCWRCHWIVEQDENDKAHPPMQCTMCPRSYHYKCLNTNERKTVPEKNWVCPDCMLIILAESSTRSPAMKKTSLGLLRELLKFALERMMELNGVEPFMHPVDRTTFPDYDKYVAHPMDLSQMKQNIADDLYGSTEAFVADAQWILHNSIIFNTFQSKLTGGARALVRSCRAEMGEIEACPECYAAAHARKPTWFTDVCTTPHILLWAKLKGFPYWPAKGMTINSSGLVDVRFFGAHDRAWVPAKDCFLFSEKDPNNFRNKRQDILDSMQEAEEHIRNICRKYVKFVYPPFKTQFDPTKLSEQLKMMIPSFEGEIKPIIKDKPTSSSPFTTKEKRRSHSKSSKSPGNDGDGSESEDTSIAARTEPINLDKDNGIDKSAKLDSPIESTPVAQTLANRKRRRSNLDEAVMTVMENSTDKKKRSDSTEQKKRTDSTELKKRTDSTELKKRTDSTELKKRTDSAEPKKRIDSTELKKRIDSAELKKRTDSTEMKKKPDSVELKKKTDSAELKKRTDSAELKKRIDSTELKKRIDSIEQKKKIDSSEQMKPEQQEPNSSKEETAKLITNEAEIVESTSNSFTETPKGKSNDEEPSSSTMVEKESLRVTPIKLVALPRPNKQTPKMFAATKAPSKPSTPKEEDKTPQKVKSARSDKPSTAEKVKEEKTKAQRRRNSKANKSLSNTGTPKAGKANEKKTESNNEATTTKELRPRDNKKKESDGEASKSRPENSLLKPISASNRGSRFDDDMTLAVIARERKHPGMPTISSVCSLSTGAAHCADGTVEASSDSSIFTPTNAGNVRNIAEAVSELQKLRENAEQVVGRVGVRAFARMTSPSRADGVQVEVKAEPVDVEEPDAARHGEKMDLMNACMLQPVNSPLTLRDVRINRVVPVASAAATAATAAGVAKRGAARSRARKTFPAPRRAEEAGRSELNGKNSMVYIPIQPPASQPPRINSASSTPRPVAPPISGNNNTVNTVTTLLKPSMSISSLPSSTATPVVVPTVGQVVGQTVGQVPTTVHTVPLMTSVNGQWMFSLQPVMSVGGGDNPTSGMVNGVSDHGSTPTIVTVSTATQNSASAPSTPAQVNRTTIEGNTPKELPRLQQRPPLHNPLDGSAALASPPPPSSAGPVTAKLNQNAGKLADFFRTLLEDTMEQLDEPAASLAALRLQLEQARWRHSQEIAELNHNHDMNLAEMRHSFERDKLRILSEARRAGQVELEAAVKIAKTKQWCANCTQEAQFYCCWNTAYCDYACQLAHWSQHFAHCAQRPKDGTGDGTSTSESGLQQQQQTQPETLPVLQKSSPSQAPALTVGGKIAASRAFTPQDGPQKASLIVSMVENNGNQTMKCVGTYKSLQGAQQNQISPVIINKQLINEEGGKKVVTSGGYLIVGAGGNSSAVITPAPSRRPHTIQYFS